MDTVGIARTSPVQRLPAPAEYAAAGSAHRECAPVQGRPRRRAAQSGASCNESGLALGHATGFNPGSIAGARPQKQAGEKRGRWRRSTPCRAYKAPKQRLGLTRSLCRWSSWEPRIGPAQLLPERLVSSSRWYLPSQGRPDVRTQSPLLTVKLSGAVHHRRACAGQIQNIAKPFSRIAVRHQASNARSCPDIASPRRDLFVQIVLLALEFAMRQQVTLPAAVSLSRARRYEVRARRYSGDSAGRNICF